MRPLFALELRRGLRAPLTWGAAACFVFLLATLGRGDSARQGLWAALLLTFVPAATIRAAGLLPRWRAGEADWIGSRPIARTPALVAAWAGTALAGAAWLALGALLIELSTDTPPDKLRLRWSQDRGEVGRLEPGQGTRVELDAPPTRAGDRLRVRVRPTIGPAPTTDVRLSAARNGNGHEETVRIATRAWVEVEAPVGDGPLWLQVHDVGAGSIAWLAEDSVELWTPALENPSFALWWRGALLVVLLGALTVGASAWMRPGPAAGAALSIVPLGAILRAPAWWPGQGLVPALTVLGEGRVPSSGGVGLALTTLLFATVGLALARPGLLSWRHGR